ncbi:hypothetical protein D1155_11630 [Anaerotruncus sp. 80]|uniref:Uncharacterized protein n=1 Tax=Anaerotruncus colihominis TaxID=169435 RepID=A0A845QMK1_9FIRM|nr:MULTISPECIES: hypothetical protein [Clostridia]NBH62301.1 hypothetical protein [Anaerotruncus colihominis]NCF00464.1 hypothetical protein [Emergencia sp. 1XD21-10]NCF02956.1 hypothetical protein [Anaerotruncus sp. 80]
MPKIVKIYLVDHPQVKRMLISKLQLQLKRGVYEKIDENAITRLLYFDKEIILEKSIIADPAYIALKKIENAIGVQYYNAFEPGYSGAVRFDGLAKKAKLTGKMVYRCDLMTADWDTDQVYSFDVQEADTVRFALKQWICNNMTATYTRCLQDYGVDLRYDPEIFPLLAAIAKQQDAQSVINMSEWGNTTPKPYSYLELFCALDGQISQADLTEILFDFYAAGVISWPMAVGDGLMESMAERILQLDSLTGTPWQKQALQYQYRDLPPYIWKNTDTQCGIWVLNVPGFNALYAEIQNEKQKLVLDTLIRRQLSLYVPDPAQVVNMGTDIQTQKLHTADSLVRLLRIYAAGSQEEITSIMGKLSACRYVIREGKGYKIREIDKSMLQYLPQPLHNMDIYSRIYQAIQKVIDGKITEGIYKETVDCVMQQDIVKMEKSLSGRRTVNEV